MLIQYLLLACFGAVMVGLLRHRRSLRSVAVRRLLLMLVSVAGIGAVLRPGLTTQVAHLVGVGRGADLVLYLLAAASVFVWAGLHLRLREYDEQLVLLARRLAIAEALARRAEVTAPPAAAAGLALPEPRTEVREPAGRVSP